MLVAYGFWAQGGIFIVPAETRDFGFIFAVLFEGVTFYDKHGVLRTYSNPDITGVACPKVALLKSRCFVYFFFCLNICSLLNFNVFKHYVWHYQRYFREQNKGNRETWARLVQNSNGYLLYNRPSYVWMLYNEHIHVANDSLIPL